MNSANKTTSQSFNKKLKSFLRKYFLVTFPDASRQHQEPNKIKKNLFIWFLVCFLLNIDSIIGLIDLLINGGRGYGIILEVVHIVFLVTLDFVLGLASKYSKRINVTNLKSDLSIMIIKVIVVCFDIEMTIYLDKKDGQFLLNEGMKLVFIETLVQKCLTLKISKLVSLFLHGLYISLRLVSFTGSLQTSLSFFLIYPFWFVIEVLTFQSELKNEGADTSVQDLMKKTTKGKSIKSNKPHSSNNSFSSKEKFLENDINTFKDPYFIIDLIMENISDLCIIYDEHNNIKFRNNLAKDIFLEDSDFSIHVKDNSLEFDEISVVKEIINKNNTNHSIIDKNACNYNNPLLNGPITFGFNTIENIREKKTKMTDLLEKLRRIKNESSGLKSIDLFNSKWLTLNEAVEIEIEMKVGGSPKSLGPNHTNLLASLASPAMKMHKKIKKYPFLTKQTFDLKLFINSEQKNSNDIICFFIDKSPEKAVKNLIMINENKSKTISFVSHEIRTPLNCIMNMLKIVENKLDEASYEKIIKPAEISASFLLNLVNDLLDMAQIEAGKFKLNYLEFDLKMLLSDIITLIKIQADSRKIELILNCDPKIRETIKSDPNRIRQIIINLLGNALKFTTKGDIKIKAKPVANFARLIKISVKDSGIGIKEEDQRKLFQAFGRLDLGENESLNIQGVGLGLLISNTLSMNLGPKMTTSSGLQVKSAPGKGTKFYFVIEDQNEENYDDMDLAAHEKTLADQMNILSKKYGDQCAIVHFRSNSCELKDNEYVVSPHKPKLRKKKTILDDSDQKQHFSADQFQASELTNFGKKMIQSEHSGSKKKRKNNANRKVSVNFLKEFFPNKKLMKRTQLLTEFMCTRHQNSKRSIEFVEVEEAITAIVKQNVNKICDCFQILICDDNDFNILPLRYHLEELHFKVDSCFSGEEAINKLKIFEENNNPCCKTYQMIFMDIEMPGKNGITTTREILKLMNGRFKDQVVIGCTGHSSEKEKKECLAAGMKTMMTKPITKGVLLTILAKYINLKEDSYHEFAENISLKGIPEEKSYIANKRKICV